MRETSDSSDVVLDITLRISRLNRRSEIATRLTVLALVLAILGTFTIFRLRAELNSASADNTGLIDRAEQALARTQVAAERSYNAANRSEEAASKSEAIFQSKP